MYGEFVPVYSCLHTPRDGTDHRTVTMAAPVLLTSGPLRHETVVLSCGTSPVTAGLVPTNDSGHSWPLYNVASLGHQAAGTMTFLLSNSVPLS